MITAEHSLCSFLTSFLDKSYFKEEDIKPAFKNVESKASIKKAKVEVKKE